MKGKINALDKAILAAGDIQNIKRAIGSLKNANSLLGMINDNDANKAKDLIVKAITTLEHMDW